jgi:hypothetical protein
MCGDGQAAVFERLKAMGIPDKNIHIHQARELIDPKQLPEGAAVNHAFIVVQMPNNKTYVIDPTFRQFFADSGPGRLGNQALSKAGGYEMADHFLAKGYVELPDKAAQDLYLSFIPVNGKLPGVPDAIQTKVSDLTLGSTAELDVAITGQKLKEFAEVEAKAIDGLTSLPDAHAFERHGGKVTDAQLKFRALSGLTPDLELSAPKPKKIESYREISNIIEHKGITVPAKVTAFHSDSNLILADRLLRAKGGGLEKALLRNNLTPEVIAEKISRGEKVSVMVKAADVGDTGIDLGRGFKNAQNIKYNSETLLKDLDSMEAINGLSSVEACYVLNPQTMQWETLTIYPSEAP